MPWDYILSVIGLIGFYFAGKKVWWSWYINILNQIFWAIYSITTEQYGFMLATVFYFCLFSRNAFLWTRDHFYSPSKNLAKLHLQDPVGRVTEVKEDAEGVKATFYITNPELADKIFGVEKGSYSIPPEKNWHSECKAVVDGVECGRESCAAVHMTSDGHDFVG